VPPERDLERLEIELLLEAIQTTKYPDRVRSKPALDKFDSLDALQVSMALHKRYGVRLADSKETRRILACVGNLADHLLQKRA